MFKAKGEHGRNCDGVTTRSVVCSGVGAAIHGPLVRAECRASPKQSGVRIPLKVLSHSCFSGELREWLVPFSEYRGVLIGL